MTAAAMPAEIDQPYALSDAQVRRFREDGFIKLPGVFQQPTLDHFGPRISELTFQQAAAKRSKPMQERSTYDKAFLQVGNLWEMDPTARALAFSGRLARIAAQLLGTEGVRMWHDQALYKEPSGGFTPWHADQQYWPMATGNCLTAWIPFHPVPHEMGPLAFGRGSHLKNIGRDLAIGEESETLIREQIKAQGILEVAEPFALGDVSFHYGWTLHRAGPNTTDQPRRVFTVIYMDRDMTLAQPKNDNQRRDWETWTPTSQIGQVMADAKNPVLWEA